MFVDSNNHLTYRAPDRGWLASEHPLARDPEVVWPWLWDFCLGVSPQWDSACICM